MEKIMQISVQVIVNTKNLKTFQRFPKIAPFLFEFYPTVSLEEFFNQQYYWFSFKKFLVFFPIGPMPLMANLMLSTRRAIVNHPHYEDVSLRQKTRKVYQMYSRRSPEDYKQTLKELQVHYVVLHSGWCLEKPWVLILKIIGFEKKMCLPFFRRKINSTTKIFVKMIFQRLP